MKCCVKFIALVAISVLAFGAPVSGVQAQPQTASCWETSIVVPASLFMTDASSKPQGLSPAEVVKLFAAVGIAIAWDPPESNVLVMDDRESYGGNGVLTEPVIHAMGFHNIIAQNSGDPVSYTLTFAKPILGLRFRRTGMVAGPSGVSHPHWIATARAANGTVVATVSEPEIRSFRDVPGRNFELVGNGRIKSVTFVGDDLARLAVPGGFGGDGQANLVIDDLGWCP